MLDLIGFDLSELALIQLDWIERDQFVSFILFCWEVVALCCSLS